MATSTCYKLGYVYIKYNITLLIIEVSERKTFSENIYCIASLRSITIIIMSYIVYIVPYYSNLCLIYS